MSKTKAQPLHKVLGAFLSAYADRKSLLECTTCIAIHKEGARAVSLGTGIHASLHVPIPLEGDESVVVPATAFALGKGEEIKAIRAEFARPEGAPKWVDRIVSVTTSAGRCIEVQGASAQGTFPVFPALTPATHSWPLSKELCAGLRHLGKMSGQIELEPNPSRERICARSVALLTDGSATGGELHSRAFIRHDLTLPHILGLSAEFAACVQEGLLSRHTRQSDDAEYLTLTTHFHGRSLTLGALAVEQASLWPKMLERVKPVYRRSRGESTFECLNRHSGAWVEQEASISVPVSTLLTACNTVVDSLKVSKQQLKGKPEPIRYSYPIALSAYAGRVYWSCMASKPVVIEGAFASGEGVRYFNAKSLGDILECASGNSVDIVFQFVQTESLTRDYRCVHGILDVQYTHLLVALHLEPSAAQYIPLPETRGVVELALSGLSFPEIVQRLGRHRLETLNILREAHNDKRLDLVQWIEKTVNSKALYAGVHWWKQYAPGLRLTMSRDELMKAARRDTKQDEGILLLCEWYLKASLYKAGERAF